MSAVTTRDGVLEACGSIYALLASYQTTWIGVDLECASGPPSRANPILMITVTHPQGAVAFAMPELAKEGSLTETLQPLVELLTDITVVKIVGNAADLADATKHHLQFVCEPTIDVRLLALFTGTADPDPGRRHRGVIRMPTVTSLRRSLNLPLSASLPAVASALMCRVPENDSDGAVSLEVVAASGRLARSLADKPQRTFTHAECHPFVPEGVGCPVVATKNGPKIAKCRQCARDHFVANKYSVCRVCAETALPCSLYKQGRCNSKLCPYKHEVIACPLGDNCFLGLTGCCPFRHPREEQQNSLPAAASDAPQTPTKQMNGAAAVDTSMEVPTPAKSEVSVTTSATVAPILAQGGKIPCRYHFAGGCRNGPTCAFSHQPIPVFLPAACLKGSKEARMTAACTKGAKCKDTKCKKVHTSAEVESRLRQAARALQ